MGEHEGDVFDINRIIDEMEAAAKKKNRESNKLSDKGMRASANWLLREALKFQQIADWLKELNGRRLRENLDE